jgi:hypothetical protein
MNKNTPNITKENEALTGQLLQLQVQFIDLFTRHKYMVENEAVILTSLYLEKLGRLQLELLEKRTEASRLKAKMKLIRAVLNRNETPDLDAIENEIEEKFKKYAAEIEAQSASIEQATNILSHLISEEDSQKLKETFRVLCRRLHPDLNPHQTVQESDLFVKMKAAYDLNDLKELQKILLYLDESKIEDLSTVPGNEKKERIQQLLDNIKALEDKMEKLKSCFPFNIKDLVFDDEAIALKQNEIQEQIKTFEGEIEKYTNIIYLMIS